ncbi:MAG: hypothetical protein GVY20_13410 [Bacteroidetes bacterium]|jgi:hypothetical protein|nr:hypothetical protein [Bacteroidota bacterium]
MRFSDYLTLSNLYKLLDNNKIGVGILGFSFLFIFTMNLATLLTIVLVAIAIPFSLYMLLVLYLHRKKGWIYGFLIVMVISLIPLFLSNENFLLLALKFTPLLTFVLYTIALRLKVGEWLMEMEHEREMTDLLNEITKN